ncbi:MAG: 3-phenylpropionate/cinnamic acid dioxygenase subunit beta [Pseudomonadota bacterium]|nr:3-phenylpropionate/cinnamic acid dioxygenase subunit beta [Pseudomonadota bacterium]
MPQADVCESSWVELHLALQQRLHYEARLLDEERFEEWLELLAPDVRYWMPMATRRFRRDRSDPFPYGQGSIFDENRERLALRVQRLRSGMVWAEDPPNRVRRIVSNIEIYSCAQQDETVVHSVIQIHRSRIDAQERRLSAGREDIWRLTDGEWRLALRRIDFDHPVVIDSNLNVFF